MKRTLVFAALALLASASLGRAETIAGWDFSGMKGLDSDKLVSKAGPKPVAALLKGKGGRPALARVKDFKGLRLEAKKGQWIEIDKSNIDLAFKKGLIITAVVRIEKPFEPKFLYTIAANYNFSDAQRSFSLHVAGGCINFDISADGKSVQNVRGPKLIAGETYEIVAVFNPGKYFSVSADGTTQTKTTAAKVLFAGDKQTPAVGARHAGRSPCNFFNGIIESIRFATYDERTEKAPDVPSDFTPRVKPRQPPEERRSRPVESFPVPDASSSAVWEAELAKGTWRQVRDKRASSGSYVEPDKVPSELEFPFTLAEPGTYEFRPKWWIHGERKHAIKFPRNVEYFTNQQVFPVAYPNPNTTALDRPYFTNSRPGPDVIDYVGRLAFFNAPETGRIGVVDLEKEKVVKVIELGGYPADVAADRAAKKVYVSDLERDRIVVLDASKPAVERELAVPAQPRSIAILDGRLFVASMKARKLSVFELPSLRPVKAIELPYIPQHVEVIDGKVVVRFLRATYDPDSGKAHLPDRLWYRPHTQNSLRPMSTSLRPENKPDPRSRWKDYSIDGKNFSFPQTTERVYGKRTMFQNVRVRGQYRPKRIAHEIDFTEVFKAPLTRATFPHPLKADKSPYKAAHADGMVFFNSPATGTLWYYDLEKRKLDRLKLGGYIADVAAYNVKPTGQILDVGGDVAGASDFHTPPRRATGKPRIFAIDSLGNRLLVIRPKPCAVIKEIPMPEMPVALSRFGVDLHVACYKGRSLVVVDMTNSTIRHTIKLPWKPVHTMAYRMQPSYTSTEFRTAIADETPLRVVLRLEPMAFDPRELKQVPPPETHYLYRRRDEITWKGPGGKTKTVFVDNNHTLRFDNTRFVSTLTITDSQCSRDVARLDGADTPGTISISLDGGPWFDWSKNIWMTPISRIALQNGTALFWRYNANYFKLSAGTHALRVKAHSPFARLDAFEVRKRLPGTLSVRLLAEPRSIHEKVRSPSYTAIFAHDEVAKFTVEAASDEPVPDLKLDYTLLDYMGTAVETGTLDLGAVAETPKRVPLKFGDHGFGTFRVKLKFRSSAGSLDDYFYFARFPKFEHPFVFFRRSEMAAVRKRIRKHARLFARWSKWLRANAKKKGFLPSRLCGAGQDMIGDGQRWRAVACAFAQVFLEPKNSTYYLDLLKPRMNRWGGTGISFQGNFAFWGAKAVVMDILCALDNDEFRAFAKDNAAPAETKPLSNFPESVLNISDPLEPWMRANLGELTRAKVNWENYFRSHTGTRGGNLWQDVRSMCRCPMHSMARGFLALRSVFGEPRLIERKIFKGWLTHASYAEPPSPPTDNWKAKSYYRRPGMRGYGHQHGPGGQPTRWAFRCLTRNALDFEETGLSEWFEAMTKRAGTMSDEEFDRRLSQNGSEILPMFLALGWVDLNAPRHKREDMPPTALFDVEGEVIMRSDEGAESTNLYFVSGVRDTSYRHNPNHLRICKAGEVLWGNCSRAYDHGTPTLAWANTVQIGTRWKIERARMGPWNRGGGRYPRMEERFVIYRFSPAMAGYCFHGYRLSKLQPVLYGSYQGGHAGPGTYDLSMHSHTWHPYLEQGKIRAFETRPEFDYACGDASNYWPADQVRELYRQIVFIRPGFVVVYDRGRLASADVPHTWTAVVNEAKKVKKPRFTVRCRKTSLEGLFLIPEYPVLAPTPHATDIYVTDYQKTEFPEYLVCMEIAMGKAPKVEAERLLDAKSAAAVFEYNGAKYEVRFRRSGVPGGSVKITRAGETRTFALPEKINDTYKFWRDDKRFKSWMTDDTFSHIIAASDRKAFSGGKGEQKGR